MDDNVALPLTCDFLVNCVEEIEKFFRNGNDFGDSWAVLLLRLQKLDAQFRIILSIW